MDRRLVKMRGVDKASGLELFRWAAVDDAFLAEEKLVLQQKEGPATYRRSGQYIEIDASGGPIYTVTYRKEVETRIEWVTFVTSASYAAAVLILLAIVLISPFFALGWVAVKLPLFLFALLACSWAVIMKRAKTSFSLSVLMSISIPILFFILFVFNQIVFGTPAYNVMSARFFSADQVLLGQGVIPPDPLPAIDFVAVGERLYGLALAFWSFVLLLVPWGMVVAAFLGLDTITAGLKLFGKLGKDEPAVAAAAAADD